MRALTLILIAVSIFVVGCMGGGGSIGGSTNGATNGSTGGGTGEVAVSMLQMSFSPATTTAHAGQVVRWTNTSNPPHTVTSDTGQAGFDSSTQFPSGISNGSSYTFTIPANATMGTHFFYHCNFHGAAGDGNSLGSGMAGEITVK